MIQQYICTIVTRIPPRRVRICDLQVEFYFSAIDFFLVILVYSNINFNFITHAPISIFFFLILLISRLLLVMGLFFIGCRSLPLSPPLFSLFLFFLIFPLIPTLIFFPLLFLFILLSFRPPYLLPLIFFPWCVSRFFFLLPSCILLLLYSST